MKNYNIGTIVEMKKQHPCGFNKWEIKRLGVDVKIECTNCKRSIMLSRVEFEKKMKKVVE